MTRNPEKRLFEHNKGKTASNKAYRPFKLIHIKEFQNSGLARGYEKFLKVSSNKEKLIETL